MTFLSALARYQKRKGDIILDGHYCLLDGRARVVSVSTEVFRQMAPRALILLSSDPQIIASRLYTRDNQVHDLSKIMEQMECEERTAALVQAELGVRLKQVEEPNALADSIAFIKSFVPQDT